MRALRLDFAAGPRAAHPAAWLLLACGALALGTAADRYADLDEGNQRLEERLQRLQHRIGQEQKPGRLKAEAAARAEGERKESQLLAQAAEPWDERLKAVESAADASVALLDCSLDAVGAKSRIVAEARTIDDALAFVARLRRSGKFDQVTLSSHEAKKSTGIDVIGFSLQLTWGQL